MRHTFPQLLVLLLLPRNWRGVTLTALRTALVWTDSESVNTRLRHRCLTSFAFSVSLKLYRHSRAFTLHEACHVWENKVRGQIFVFSLLMLHNAGIVTDGSQQLCETMVGGCVGVRRTVWECCSISDSTNSLGANIFRVIFGQRRFEMH